MLADPQHLVLTERVFQDAITHLKQRLTTPSAPLDDLDASESEQQLASLQNEHALHLQVALYRLCLDGVRRERAELAGEPYDGRTTREQFFRLMASAAQCELRSGQASRAVGFRAAEVHTSAPSEAELFFTIQQRAAEQLQTLVGI